MKHLTNIGLLIGLILGIILSSCSTSAPSPLPTETATLPPPTNTPTPPQPTLTPTLPPECQSLSHQASSPELDGREVVAKMVEHLNAGDVIGAMSFFAADAKMYSWGLPPLGYVESFGAEAICGNWLNNVNDGLKWEITILSANNLSSGTQLISAKSKIWMDAYSLEDGGSLEFSETIFVKDGLIIASERMLKPDTLSQLRFVLPAADFIRSEPAPGISGDTVGSDIKVIFTNHTCTYLGPEVWKAGTLTIEVEVQSDFDSALIFVFAGEGNDFYDMTVSENIHGLIGGRYSMHEFTPGESKTIQHDVSLGQMFLRCHNKSSTVTRIGAFGPFIVEP